MIAVPATASALKAFATNPAWEIVEPKRKTTERSTGGSGAAGEVLDFMAKASRADSESHDAEIRWLFEIRWSVVHHRAVTGETARHPRGVSVSPDMVKYSADTARRAVDLLIDTLAACVDSPTPAFAAHAATLSRFVARLRANRGV